MISLALNRSGSTSLVLYGWIMTDEVDPDRCFLLDKEAVVTFNMHGVKDLHPEGLSSQANTAPLYSDA